MNRLEIDVLKLISTDIWGGEGAVAPEALTAETAPTRAIPAPGPIRSFPLPHYFGPSLRALPRR